MSGLPKVVDQPNSSQELAEHVMKEVGATVGHGDGTDVGREVGSGEGGNVGSSVGAGVGV